MPDTDRRTAEECYRTLLLHPEGCTEHLQIAQHHGTPAVMTACRQGGAAALWITASNNVDTQLMQALRDLFRIPETAKWGISRVGANPNTWMQAAVVWEMNQ